jgi:hypothetical protein
MLYFVGISRTTAYVPSSVDLICEGFLLFPYVICHLLQGAVTACIKDLMGKCMLSLNRLNIVS